MALNEAYRCVGNYLKTIGIEENNIRDIIVKLESGNRKELVNIEHFFIESLGKENFYNLKKKFPSEYRLLITHMRGFTNLRNKMKLVLLNQHFTEEDVIKYGVLYMRPDICKVTYKKALLYNNEYDVDYDVNDITTLFSIIVNNKIEKKYKNLIKVLHKTKIVKGYLEQKKILLKQNDTIQQIVYNISKLCHDVIFTDEQKLALRNMIDKINMFHI